MIIVYDESHTLIWSYLFSGNDADEGYTIHIDSSYNLVIGGVTQSFATGSGDMILLSYKIDMTPPISSISFIPYKETSIVNASTEFSITAEDVDGCGVATIKYRIDSGSWIDYTGAFNLSGYSLGNHEIGYYAIDILDNTEDINTLNVELIDITVPPGISGYNIAFIIGLVVISSMPILHKKLKKQK